MTSPQQTLVFSRYYNQGPGWVDKKSGQHIFNAIRENNWDRVRDHWNNLIRHYNQKGPRWKYERYSKEFKYFWPDEPLP